MPRNVVELRELGDPELIARLESNKEELFNLRFQLATGQLDNPMRIKQVRHDVARILTVLRERHLESEIEEQVARADREALTHAREGRAEAPGRRGFRRFRARAAEAGAEEEQEAGADEAEVEPQDAAKPADQDPAEEEQ